MSTQKANPNNPNNESAESIAYRDILPSKQAAKTVNKAAASDMTQGNDHELTSNGGEFVYISNNGTAINADYNA